MRGIQQYQDEGYSRGEAKKLAKEYVAEPGTSEHELGIAVDINADTSKCSSDAVYTWHPIMHINMVLLKGILIIR